MFISWNDNLKLGIPLIDIQHRMLMFLCRKLDVAIKERQSEDVVQMITLELKLFAEFHFRSEENLMREIGYPDLNTHVKEHTGLLMELNLINRKIRRYHLADAGDFLSLLHVWLLNHITACDLQISVFAKSSENRPVAEEFYGQFLSAPHVKELNVKGLVVSRKI